MLDDDQALLELMLKDMALAPAVYQPTPFWCQCIKQLLEEMNKIGINGFKAAVQTRRYFVPNYGYPTGERERLAAKVNNAIQTFPVFSRRLAQVFSGELLAKADYRVLRATETESPPYTSRATESPLGQPAEQFKFDDRCLSKAFFNYLLGVNFLKRHLKGTKIKRILEIGGGYGALGEALLSDSRNDIFYLDIDIPPTLYVATQYLKGVFGAKSIGDYRQLKPSTPLDIAKLESCFRAVMLCPWQLPDLVGQIDLFVNFISFQEMEPNVVANYLKEVDRLEPAFVLLRNMREGKQRRSENQPTGVEKPILGDDYDNFLPAYELVATDSQIFGWVTEDGFHSELRLYRRKDP